MSGPRLHCWLLAFGFISLTSLSAHAQSPLGSEFRVNSQTGTELEPDIASGPDGVFTTVWIHAPDPSEGPQNINARRFSLSGQTSEELTLVEASAPYHAVDLPKVTPDSRGGWTLFYSQYHPDGYRQILASRFSRVGSARGSHFVVSKPLPSFADLHAVVSTPSGGYFFLSEDDLCPGCRRPSHHLFARVLDPRGGYSSPYFLVDTDKVRVSFSGAKSLGVDAAENAVVVWETQPDVIVPEQTAILGQRFSPAGERLGNTFRINRPGPGIQILPSVAVNPGGDFVVVWQYQPDPHTPRSLRARHFSKEGKPVGDEFIIEADSVADSVIPSIAADPQGNYVVVWTSYGSPFCTSVKGRLFRPDDKPAGPSFYLSSGTDSCDQSPQVAFGPQGAFAAVWERFVDTGGFDIYATIFRAGPAGGR